MKCLNVVGGGVLVVGEVGASVCGVVVGGWVVALGRFEMWSLFADDKHLKSPSLSLPQGAHDLLAREPR